MRNDTPGPDITVEVPTPAERPVPAPGTTPSLRMLAADDGAVCTDELCVPAETGDALEARG